MPKIEFTATPELPHDIAHLDYKEGDVLDLPEASARRWIRRGVAKYVNEGVVLVEETMPALPMWPGTDDVLVFQPAAGADLATPELETPELETPELESPELTVAPAWEPPAGTDTVKNYEDKPRRGRKPKAA